MNAGRRALTALVILALALGISACGGGGSGESDEEQVEAVIKTALTSTDPSACGESRTIDFRAWAQFSREQGAGEVLVHLVGGLMIRGGFGRRSQVDLSPSPPGLFLEEGFGYRMNDDGKVVLEDTGRRGIYLAGSEILAVYFVDGEGNEGEGGTDQLSNEEQADEPAADKETADETS